MNLIGPCLHHRQQGMAVRLKRHSTQYSGVVPFKEFEAMKVSVDVLLLGLLRVCPRKHRLNKGAMGASGIRMVGCCFETVGDSLLVFVEQRAHSGHEHEAVEVVRL